MNRAVITGNLTKDPQARTTQSGISTSSFTVAVQRRFKNANGTYDADFIPVVAWRQTADYCNKYLAKGRKVAVEGSIQTRSYDAQDGSKRFVTELIADHVEALSSLREQGEQGEPETTRPVNEPDAEGFVEVDDSDDLPF